ncbi:hypothetical protein BGX29_004220 [Mortierella sp. GBA35]|nr:hypothetical protein BGX29_004220 [Mortierella sp. GBA35]
MDPLSRLPLECLQHILHILARGSSTVALASLLRVSKTIASVALPYLYSDPFNMYVWNTFKWTLGHRKWDSSSGQQLARMLLSRVTTTEFPKAVSIYFGLDTDGFQPSPLDYTPHIHHLNLERKTLGPEVFAYYQDPLPEVLESVKGDEEFQRACHTDRLLPSYVGSFGDEKSYLYCQLRVMVNREAHWAIANPILEQLQSLTIPLSDIKRYLGAVDRFESLERLRFCLNEVFDYQPQEADSASTEFKMTMKKHKDETMRSVVRFVQEHARIFKSRLKSITCPNGHFWPRIQQTCPEEVQFEFLRVLPALYRPTHLNESNWLQFVAHSLSTDLGRVEEIVVEEKKSMEDLGIDIYNVPKQHISLLQEDSRPAFYQHSPIPLQKAVIYECKTTPLTDEIDDIAYSFRQSLWTLCVYGSESLPALPLGVHTSDNISRYRCQDLVLCLPASLESLSSLHLNGWNALTFHPDTLLHYGDYLMELILGTQRQAGGYFIPPDEELNRSYNIQDESSDGSTPLMTPAIIRPHWTWDWNLPELKALILTSEFAYRFKFRMLDRCPLLETLELHIASIDGLHFREISVSDLFMPPAISHDDDNDDTSSTFLQPPLQRIVVPRLGWLTMTGHWIINDGDTNNSDYDNDNSNSFLSEFVNGMFPTVEDVTMLGWSGSGFNYPSILNFVHNATMAMEIKQVNVSLPQLSPTELDELRMVDTNYDDDWQEDDLLQTNIFLDDGWPWYRLRRDNRSEAQ